jgi:hypothetical protein
MRHSIRALGEGIFCAEFEDEFDLAMTFWRCQEFYESPNLAFRGKPFTLIDYMKWYSETEGRGGFTYPYDWSGFNLPGRVISACFRKGIPDPSKYDRAMRSIYKVCRERSRMFYLIGVMRGDTASLAHEKAHALWGLNSEYRREMKRCLNQIPSRTAAAISSALIKQGYAKFVIPDETQAYLSTGLSSELESVKIPKTIIKMFRDVSRKFSR